MADDNPTLTPAGRNPTEADRSIRLSLNFWLFSVRFQRCSASASVAFTDLHDEGEILFINRFTRPSVRRSGEGNDEVDTELTFLFQAREKLPSGEERGVADARATLILKYLTRPGKELSDEDVDLFARYHAPFHAWGYWREFIHSSLARLELPPYTAPMFRLAEVPKYMIEMGDSESGAVNTSRTET